MASEVSGGSNDKDEAARGAHGEVCTWECKGMTKREKNNGDVEEERRNGRKKKEERKAEGRRRKRRGREKRTKG